MGDMGIHSFSSPALRLGEAFVSHAWDGGFVAFAQAVFQALCQTEKLKKTEETTGYSFAASCTPGVSSLATCATKSLDFIPGAELNELSTCQFRVPSISGFSSHS